MRRLAGDLKRTTRRGQATPLAVGAAGLTLVVAALWFFSPRGPVETAPAAPPTVALPSVAPAAVTVATPVVAAAPVEAAEVATDATPSLDETVRGYLAAGEFGAAFDTALTAVDVNEQTQLLQLVADAQAAAGEFAAARQTLKQIPAAAAKVAGWQETAVQESLAGGSGADPWPLINLILQLTGDEDNGPWETVQATGDGAPDPIYFDGGVRVDPNGFLALVTRGDLKGRAASAKLEARDAALNTDMAQPSELRMVSLTRLDRAIQERFAAGKPVVESMRQLAGLSEIQYVFVYPEEREIVIAGPAEGWRYNETMQPVGASTGRPTLQLDDLVTVLRTFSRDGENVFGCSIDPRPENLQALKDFVAQSQASGPLAPGGASRWADRLGQTLGRQDVTIQGVPGDSRVARVIVEADYRMKLIGVGKLNAGTQIPNYFTLLARNPSQASGRIDALRWWMTLRCDEVLHSDGRTAFELRGPAVQCLSENELLGARGQRIHTGDAEPVNRQFAANFTEHYATLAQQEPVFADLQGVFNLALVAALIQHDGLDRKAGWDRGVFRSGGAYVTASYPVPKEVDTVVNHRVFNGKDVVVQVAGGVTGDLMGLLKNTQAQQADSKLDGVAAQSRAGELPAGRWWWDAK